MLGLAGESGSGKTTLGSIISLTARPPLHVEHGSLEIDGKVQDLVQHGQDPADLARFGGLDAARRER